MPDAPYFLSATISLYRVCNLVIGAVYSYCIFLSMNTETKEKLCLALCRFFLPKILRSPIFEYSPSHPFEPLSLKKSIRGPGNSLLLLMASSRIIKPQSSLTRISTIFCFLLCLNTPKLVRLQVVYHVFVHQLGYSNI